MRRQQSRFVSVVGMVCVSAVTWASSVVITIDTVQPDPVLINDTLTATATAVFTADGDDQEQLTAGKQAEYRFLWDLQHDGTVASTEPALDPGTAGWTVWSVEPTSSVSGSFPTTGLKAVQAAVEVRLNGEEGPSETVAQGSATGTARVTVDLADVTNLEVIEVGIDYMTLSWTASVSPEVAGYAYHIEPDEGNIVDIGNVTQTTITGLEPGIEYTVGVHVYDADGNMTHTVYATATTKPEPPIALTAYGEDGEAVLILGRSPTSTVTAYKVEQSTDDGQTWSLCAAAANPIPGWYSATAPHDYCLFTATGLTNGTQYRFRAVALVGSSSKSAPKQSNDATPRVFHNLYEIKRDISRFEACMGLTVTEWDRPLGSVQEVQEVRAALEEAARHCRVPRLSYQQCSVPTQVHVGVDPDAEESWVDVTIDYDTGTWESPSVPSGLAAGGWLPLPDIAHPEQLTPAHMTQLCEAFNMLEPWQEAGFGEVVKEVHSCTTDYKYEDGGSSTYPPTTNWPYETASDAQWFSEGGNASVTTGWYVFYDTFPGDPPWWFLCRETQKRTADVTWHGYPANVEEFFCIQTGTVGARTPIRTTIVIEPRATVPPLCNPEPWAFESSWGRKYGWCSFGDGRPGTIKFYKKMMLAPAAVTDITFGPAQNTSPYAALLRPNEYTTLTASATYAVSTTPVTGFTVPLPLKIASGGTGLAHLHEPGTVHAVRAGTVEVTATANWLGGGIPISLTKSIDVGIVAVNKVRKRIGASTAWSDFGGPQKILFGKRTHLQATDILPPGVILPPGTPVWEGTFGASGAGLETSHTYSGAASSSDTDTKTVRTDLGPNPPAEFLICALVLGIHSNVAPTAGFTDGHAWISLADHSSGTPPPTLTIGLWPDAHSLTTDNGPGTDVRVNMEPSTGVHNRFYLLAPSQVVSLSAFISRTAHWRYINTCANWAEAAVQAAVGEAVSSSDRVVFGTPRAISESIEDLEADGPTGPDMPLGGGEDAPGSTPGGGGGGSSFP